jgi:alkylhydroperoxidase/carboxymuconolactone decarboxylase family protein
MGWNRNEDTDGALATLERTGLLKDAERAAFEALARANGGVGAAVARAESLHLHIKVDDTHALPLNDFFAAGAKLDHQKDGFVKWRFPGGVNAIFSHIPVSQDELCETPANRRARPFLDHLGVDLRTPDAASRAAFDALPGFAAQQGWLHAAQGSPDKPVYCCHSSVAEKHWLYPEGSSGHADIPVEFAFGPLVIDFDSSGCDLRPAKPGTAAANAACCAAPASTGHGASGGARSYYQPEDLKRFSQVARSHPALGEAFFRYYGEVMKPGLLDAREKALIALAIAHAQKCPYCIDAYTETLHGLGVSEPEMHEAVQVAASMLAGITLVHSVQMLNRLDELKR